MSVVRFMQELFRRYPFALLGTTALAIVEGVVGGKLLGAGGGGFALLFAQRLATVGAEHDA